MPIAISKAKQIDQPQRKSIAIAAIQQHVNITELSSVKQVSRKFIYQQKNKAINGINEAGTCTIHGFNFSHVRP